MFMNDTNIALLKSKWHELLRQLGHTFGEEPDLQGIIFLIGVQELGQGVREFSKDEKQDLMHIATCRLLSFDGYYELVNRDEQGWPHWNKIKPIPLLSLKEQDIVLKENIIRYFEGMGYQVKE